MDSGRRMRKSVGPRRGSERMARARAAVLAPLGFLQATDALGASVVDLGDVPAIEPGIRVDLRTMMNVVLGHHQQHPPAGEGNVAIDRLHFPGEPVVGGAAEQPPEFGEALFERRHPAVAGGDIRRWRADPAFAAVGACEVEPRARHVTDELVDRPRLLARPGRRCPAVSLRRKGSDVANRPAMDPFKVAEKVGDGRQHRVAPGPREVGPFSIHHSGGGR